MPNHGSVLCHLEGPAETVSRMSAMYRTAARNGWNLLDICLAHDDLPRFRAFDLLVGIDPHPVGARGGELSWACSTVVRIMLARHTLKP
jgi:hypothetical protein